MTQTIEQNNAEPFHHAMLLEEIFLQQAFVLGVLKESSISRAIMSFNGSGDEGIVNELEVYDAQGNEIDPYIASGQTTTSYLTDPNEPNAVSQTGQLAISDLLIDLTDNVLECMLGQWENEDGASGSLEIDVETGVMQLKSQDHSQNIDVTNPILMTFDAELNKPSTNESSGFTPESVELLIERLQEAGITVVSVKYDSSDNEKSPLDISAFNENSDVLLNTQIPALVPKGSVVSDSLDSNSSLQENSVTLLKALEDAFEHLISNQHFGYENGEGGGGEFTYNVDTGFVTLEKWDRCARAEVEIFNFAHPDIGLDESLPPVNPRSSQRPS